MARPFDQRRLSRSPRSPPSRRLRLRRPCQGRRRWPVTVIDPACACSITQPPLTSDSYMALVIADAVKSSARSSVAACPDLNTTTRSQNVASSSTSELVTMIVRPLDRASSDSSRQMSCRAPTSTPRVGSSSISNRGCRQPHRPSNTFCWLPPDSVPIGSVTLAGRTRYWSVRISAAAAFSAMVEAPPSTESGRRSGQVLEHRQAGEDAVALAVGGQKRDAGVHRVGRGGAVRTRHRRSRPYRRRSDCSPNRAGAMSSHPEPGSPARPRISPWLRLERHRSRRAAREPFEAEPNRLLIGSPRGDGARRSPCSR